MRRSYLQRSVDRASALLVRDVTKTEYITISKINTGKYTYESVLVLSRGRKKFIVVKKWMNGFDRIAYKEFIGSTLVKVGSNGFMYYNRYGNGFRLPERVVKAIAEFIDKTSLKTKDILIRCNIGWNEKGSSKYKLYDCCDTEFNPDTEVNYMV